MTRAFRNRRRRSVFLMKGVSLRVRWLKTTAGYGLLVSSLLTVSLDAGAQELQPVGNPLATVAAAGDVQDEAERGERRARTGAS